MDDQPDDVRILIAREANLFNSNDAALFEQEVSAAGGESANVILDLSAIRALGPDSVIPLNTLSRTLANASKRVAIVGLAIESYVIVRGFRLHHRFVWAHNLHEALDGLMKDMPRIVGYPVALIEELESAVIVTTCLRLMYSVDHFSLFKELMLEIIALGKHVILDYSATEWIATHIGLLDTVRHLDGTGKKMVICGMSNDDRENIHRVNAASAFVWAQSPQDALGRLVA